MEQRLYDAAAKLPATNAKLDTSQMTGKIRATNSIGRVVITLAACAAAMCIILFGALSLASSVKEYNDAVAYFSMHNLSTDGLSRKEIKDVYKDIISGSFTHPKTADVLASKDNTEPQPTDPIDPQPTEPTDPNVPVVLPEYVPGSIKLAAKDAYTTWAPKDRQYRASYYLLMGNFANIVRNSRPEEYEQWKTAIDDAIKRGEWKDEMLLVTYIKHFDIPRATMEAALYSYTYNRTPLQLQTEFYEAPNLDIIYTFDNEIINRYYRYELAATDPVPKSNLDPVTGLPIGVPEGFVFAPQDAGEIAPLDRKYRVCYYQALGPFASLGADRPDEKSAILNERWEDVKQGIYRDEMWLVSIIKGLNIPREEFDRAVAKYLLQYDPEDLMTEYCEIPNGDIIYTFDNEIINAYYRYEEPDWDVVVPQLSENKVHMKFDGQEYHYVDWHIGPDAYIYRSGYHNIWGEFLELANNRPGKSFDEWVKLRIAETSTAQACNEAALISFLKYFEVPKEDFEAALEKYISRHTPQELDWDYYWVLPDADIIYTFDNEVINQYYRKEDSNTTNPSNPTVPNPTEPTDPSEPVEPTDPEPTEPGPTEPCSHVWGQWIVVAEATCDQSGKQERSCDYCDEKQTQEIPKREHEESDWIIDKPADVGVEGHKHTECIRCHRQMREETIPAITQDHQHSATTWVISTYPGCTTSGTTQRVCSCGEVLETKSIAPVGHDHILTAEKKATCTENGSLTYACTRCSNSYTTKINAPGHVFGDWQTIREPANGQDGEARRTCKNCTFYETKTLKDESKVAEGTWGTMTWVVFKDGRLVVTGSGAMQDAYTEGYMASKHVLPGWCDYKAQITTIILDDRITVIGDSNFYYMYCAKSVHLPASLQEIRNKGFVHCGLDELIFPDTLTVIGDSAFEGYDGTTLVLPYSCKSIGECAFGGSDYLKTADLSHVTTIGQYAFSGCEALERVKLCPDLKEIPLGLFKDCWMLTELSIPDSVESIGDKAFLKCFSLKTLGIGANTRLTSIGNAALPYGLTTFEIPRTVTFVGTDNFDNAWEVLNLSSATVPFTPASEHAQLITSAADSRVTKENGFVFFTTEDGEGILIGCDVNTSQITIPSQYTYKGSKLNVTGIADYAIRGCWNTEKVVLPTTLQYIDKFGFMFCPKLENCVWLSSQQTLDQLEFDWKKWTWSQTNVHQWQLISCLNPDGKEFYYLADQGTCGTNTTYKLYGSGVLSIEGNGAVTEILHRKFTSTSGIKYVVINPGITELGTSCLGNFLSAEFVYTGTPEQWEQVKKGYSWGIGQETLQFIPDFFL